MVKHFTRRATRILCEFAPREAKRLGHRKVHCEHVMLGMINRDNDSLYRDLIVGTILNRYGVNVDRLRLSIEKHLQNDAPPSQTESRQGLRSLENHAHTETLQNKDLVTGTEHLLLALLQDSQGIVATSLAPYGLMYNALRAEIARRPRIDL